VRCSCQLRALPSAFDCFARWLPNVELHAHLNGPISPQVINELIHHRNAASMALTVAPLTHPPPQRR